MAGPALRNLVLESFEDDLRKVLRPAEILAAVKAQVPEADEASIRAKLSDWVQEGVLQKGNHDPTRAVADGMNQRVRESIVSRLAFGEYALREVAVKENPLEQAVANILAGVLKPKALRRAVIWDATPFLSLAEDGAPGVRLVIEHAAGPSIKDAIESNWATLISKFPKGEKRPLQTLAWIVHRRGPLGDHLWEPERPGPSVIDLGVVIVADERLGGTGLTQHGYRAPSHERILTEFMAEELDAAAAHDILRAGLLHKTFSIKRAEEAARTLGTMYRLWTLLTAAQPQLPEPLRSQVLDKVPAYVRGFLETTE